MSVHPWIYESIAIAQNKIRSLYSPWLQNFYNKYLLHGVALKPSVLSFKWWFSLYQVKFSVFFTSLLIYCIMWCFLSFLLNSKSLFYWITLLFEMPLNEFDTPERKAMVHTSRFVWYFLSNNNFWFGKSSKYSVRNT